MDFCKVTNYKLKSFISVVIWISLMIFPHIKAVADQPMDTLLISMKKSKGIGPVGNIALNLMSTSQMPKEYLSILPVIRNEPALKEKERYYYIYNREQFLFQNYKKEMISKSFFEQEMLRIGRKPTDTLDLTARELRCGFGILTGKDSLGGMVYVLDQNNNNDFKDDFLKVLPNSPFSTDKLSENQSVNLDFYSENGPFSEDVHYYLSQFYLRKVAAKAVKNSNKK